MSEAAGSGSEEVRQRVIEKSIEDEGFRERLLADPRAAIEEETGVKLPTGVEIKAVEETPEIVYVVLPPVAPTSRPGGELSDSELEAVAGGWDPPPFPLDK